ncbi:nucleotidyl transferase AbiEii/AbiGii toxin family protein [Candidatus Babeliales bacterium]|nr:nucleotidyl transferase AbiEii/AbiGii toxin family protein [Candidatus Babeliales bacterium]MCF7899608.1 nucleotidyl transferase AbiEii/AbiGii toxin family protein [Candidatus Babeliales bacterium]
MSLKVIENRLKEYNPISAKEELNAFKEIIQEIALCGLFRVNFFKQAAFQGGSCLRIVHGLNRFSEDLDFILFEPNQIFIWEPFLSSLQLEFKSYNLEFSVIDKSKADKTIKMAFLKENSFGKVFVFDYPRGLSDKQTIKIKFEVDTNPPSGSKFEKKFINFPYAFSIATQDMPSLFASKCHALLCRPYVKGRDWFDFVWYISKKIIPNFILLSNAVNQAGPWKNQNINISKDWLINALNKKIESINWDEAKFDAKNFLRVKDRDSLEVWGKDFFLAMVKKFSDDWKTCLWN